MKSIVLLSGGLDSTVALYWAKSKGEVLAAVGVNYCQRHWVELPQAAKIAREAGVPFESEQLGARGVGLNAALTRADASISTAAQAIVPCRNLAFLTLAAAWVEKLGADSIVVGFSAADAADFPDCRAPFARAAATAISLSLGRKVLIHAPLIDLGKVATLELAKSLGCWSALRHTWTCYTPERAGVKVGHVRPCGVCPSCTLRAQAFAELGETDPAAGKEIRG